MTNRIKALLFTVPLLALLPAALAQTTTGAITGTVTDPSGAAIPNAHVTATNVATNVANSTRSNATESAPPETATATRSPA